MLIVIFNILIFVMQEFQGHWRQLKMELQQNIINLGQLVSPLVPVQVTVPSPSRYNKPAA